MELLEKFCIRIDSDQGYDNLKLAKDLETLAKKHLKLLRLHIVSQRTFRFSGLRHGKKFVKEIQAIDQESSIADFELTYPNLTWRTITELD